VILQLFLREAGIGMTARSPTPPGGERGLEAARPITNRPAGYQPAPQNSAAWWHGACLFSYSRVLPERSSNMPRGASPKREREYEELKSKFHRSGRYGGRADEVAARIVNKQRAEYGETKGEKKQEKAGKSPDENLPLDHYRHLTIAQLKPRLKSLSKRDLQKVKSYEQKNKNRAGAIHAIDAELSHK
jgi:hypothetical protein